VRPSTLSQPVTDDTETAPDADAATARPPDGSADDGDAADDGWAYPDDDPDEADVAAATERRGPTGRREVEVPLRLYKTVTVFSTLIAVASVLAGFVALDAATLRVSVVRRLVVGLLAAVDLTPGEGALTGLFAAVGLGLIGFGAAVYVFGTRFRAPGMGNAEERSDESSNDG